MFTSSRRLAVALSRRARCSSAAAPELRTTRRRDADSQPAAAGPRAARHVRVAPVHMANTGLQVGARVGYGGGAGVVYSGLDVREASSGGIPIIVDLGARVMPRALRGHLRPVRARSSPRAIRSRVPTASTATRSSGGSACELDFHYVPRSRLDPYVGLGGGYEVLHTNVTGPVPVPTALGTLHGNAHASITD